MPPRAISPSELVVAAPLRHELRGRRAGIDDGRSAVLRIGIGQQDLGRETGDRAQPRTWRTDRSGLRRARLGWLCHRAEHPAIFASAASASRRQRIASERSHAAGSSRSRRPTRACRGRSLARLVVATERRVDQRAQEVVGHRRHEHQELRLEAVLEDVERPGPVLEAHARDDLDRAGPAEVDERRGPLREDPQHELRIALRRIGVVDERVEVATRRRADGFALDAAFAISLARDERRCRTARRAGRVHQRSAAISGAARRGSRARPRSRRAGAATTPSVCRSPPHRSDRAAMQARDVTSTLGQLAEEERDSASLHARADVVRPQARAPRARHASAASKRTAVLVEVARDRLEHEVARDRGAAPDRGCGRRRAGASRTPSHSAALRTKIEPGSSFGRFSGEASSSIAARSLAAIASRMRLRTGSGSRSIARTNRFSAFSDFAPCTLRRRRPQSSSASATSSRDRALADALQRRARRRRPRGRRRSRGRPA